MGKLSRRNFLIGAGAAAVAAAPVAKLIAAPTSAGAEMTMIDLRAAAREGLRQWNRERFYVCFIHKETWKLLDEKDQLYFTPFGQVGEHCDPAKLRREARAEAKRQIPRAQG